MMYSEDLVKQDKETEKWLAEIESFRSPPPPRKLLGSVLIPASSPLDQQISQKSSSPNNIVAAQEHSSSKIKNLVEAECEKRLRSLNISANNSTSEKVKCQKKHTVVPVIDKHNNEKVQTDVKYACKPSAVATFHGKCSSYDNIPIKRSFESNGNSKNDTLFKPHQDALRNQNERLFLDYTHHEESLTQSKCASVKNLNDKCLINGFSSKSTAVVYDTPVKQYIASESSSKEPRSHNNYSDHRVSNNQNSRPLVIGACALDKQQSKFEELADEIEKELERHNESYGQCCECGDLVKTQKDATQAMGRLYHSACFTCSSCGRTLTGKQFYEACGKIYCEEDYLFSGYQESTERCAICGHFIMDMILQAVNKSFHPTCFRCTCCKESLDGVPFTIDDKGSVYCVADYHRLFSPKCAKCQKSITPTNGRDETVRVVAMQKDYHVDCYVCEGCGLQLTDEVDRRCYPLDGYLLCYDCHVRWSSSDKNQHYLVSDV